MGALLDFLFPANCVVCGAVPQPLCPGCLPEAVGLEIEVGQLRLSAGLGYQGAVVSMLTGYKDRKLTALAKPLAQILDPVLADLVQHANYFALAPSVPDNLRTRGFHPMRLVLAHIGSIACLREVRLFADRPIAEQRNLGRLERSANLSGALSAPIGSGKVLLIDDVVTTGATMTEMARALGESGFEVVGGCAIAVSSSFLVTQDRKKA